MSSSKETRKVGRPKKKKGARPKSTTTKARQRRQEAKRIRSLFEIVMDEVERVGYEEESDEEDWDDADGDSDADTDELRVATNDFETYVKTTLEEEETNISDSCLEAESMRKAVAFIFVTKYKGVRDEKCWKGKKGIIPKIRADLGLNPKTKLIKILRGVVNAYENDEIYNGDHNRHNCGRNTEISPKSEEAQLICDITETGGSQTMAWRAANRLLKERGKESVTKSAVIGLMKKLRPIMIQISKRNQGSAATEDDAICIARMLWVIQLGIRFGVIDYSQIKKKHPHIDDRTVPDYFNVEKLKSAGLMVDPDDVTWWDEVHRQCHAGSNKEGSVLVNSSRQFIPAYKRDKDGKIVGPDEEGQIKNKKITQMVVKYQQEARFGFGVYMDQDKTCGETEKNTERYIGRRCKPFDYTSKIILSPKDYDEKIRTEINRVRNSPPSRYWCEDTAPQGAIYDTDEVDALKGVAATKKKQLNLLQIKSVKDVKDISEEKLGEVLSLPGFGKGTVDNMVKHAKAAIAGARPAVIDLTKAENPYKAKFGDEWRSRIKECSALSSFSDVRDLAYHIGLETHNAGKSWFYHDALSLLTCNDTVEYMKQTKVSGCKKSLYEMWLRPELGLFSNNQNKEWRKKLKRFYGRPPGNSADLMPLDTTLNRDLHTCVNIHVDMTNTMNGSDPRKFSLATPKLAASAYKRIYDPDSGVAPSSERIVEDISTVIFDTFEMIADAKGLILSDNNRRDRKRSKQIKHAGKKRKIGGYRPRTMPKDFYADNYIVHSDANLGMKIKIEESIKKYNKIKAEKEEQFKEEEYDSKLECNAFEEDEEIIYMGKE